MTEHAAVIGLQPGESRSELIERVKKEQRPAWLQSLAKETSQTSHAGLPSHGTQVVRATKKKSQECRLTFS